MKKQVGVFIMFLILSVLLVTNCRPPLIEGAVVDIQHQRYDKAFETLQQAVTEYPENPEGWYLLGTLYERKEQYEKMNECFEKSLALSEQYKSDIEQLRYKSFSENYNTGLKNYYRKAQEEQDPDQRKAFFEKAADKFMKAQEVVPSRSEPYAPLAASLLEIGDTTKAETYLEKAVEMNPNKDTLITTVGDFYYRANRTDKAKELYDKAIEINPSNSLALLALGEIYAKEQQWNKALDNFQTAMELHPDDPMIPMNIAIIYYNNGNYEDAIPQLKKTIEISPENKKMYELLSLSHIQLAQKHMDKYTEEEDQASKQNAEELYDKVLPFLEDAVNRFPYSSILWNNLGVVYAQKGMKEKAQEAFEKQKVLEESE